MGMSTNAENSEFRMLNVYTGTASEGDILPEKIFSSEELEQIQVMLDHFFSATEKDAVEYQKELDATSDAGQVFAKRITGKYIAAVWKSMFAWDYHDESWHYEEILTAEKITQKEYELGIMSASTEDSIELFSTIAESAQVCHVWYAPKYAKGLLNNCEMNWSTYAVAYMTGFPTLPGFYRFIYANGDSR